MGARTKTLGNRAGCRDSPRLRIGGISGGDDPGRIRKIAAEFEHYPESEGNPPANKAYPDTAPAAISAAWASSIFRSLVVQPRSAVSAEIEPQHNRTAAPQRPRHAIYHLVVQSPSVQRMRVTDRQASAWILVFRVLRADASRFPAGPSEQMRFDPPCHSVGPVVGELHVDAEIGSRRSLIADCSVSRSFPLTRTKSPWMDACTFSLLSLISSRSRALSRSGCPAAA